MNKKFLSYCFAISFVCVGQAFAEKAEIQTSDFPKEDKVKLFTYSFSSPAPQIISLKHNDLKTVHLFDKTHKAMLFINEHLYEGHTVKCTFDEGVFKSDVKIDVKYEDNKYSCSINKLLTK